VWHCAEEIGYPFGPAIQLLILTGQRRGEVFEAIWNEINVETATCVLRSARSKNGSEHMVPLSEPALQILRALPRVGGSRFLFTTTGTSPVSGISKAKARLDQMITHANGGKAIPPWRIHDLRRTFVSGCARLRIPSKVVERAINHTSGSFGGVRGGYNVFAYEDERRDAMRVWASYVLANLSLTRANCRFRTYEREGRTVYIGTH
jgi:integrase